MELSRLLYLDASEVRAACRSLDVFEIVRGVLRLHAQGGAILPSEAHLRWPTPSGGVARSLGMSGFVDIDGGAAGIKVINANPANVERGIPRASGLSVVFERETARPLAIMDGGYISALRTACVSLLALELLHDGAPVELTLVGAGRQARAHLEGLLTHVPDLRRILLCDLVPDRAEALAEEFRSNGRANGTELVVMDDVEQATRAATAVIAVTTTTRGYIEHSWLGPGSVLVNVSLDDALPDVVERADLVFVDDWKLVREDEHRLLGRLYREGRVTGPEDAPRRGARAVDAELGWLLTGRHPGRSAANQVVLVNPFGLAIEDVAVARRVYEVARESGLGSWLPFE